jgi:hypothetical protein
MHIHFPRLLVRVGIHTHFPRLLMRVGILHIHFPRLLTRVQGASMRFHESHDIGQLLNRFTFDVDMIDTKIPGAVCGME